MESLRGLGTVIRRAGLCRTVASDHPFGAVCPGVELHRSHTCGHLDPQQICKMLAVSIIEIRGVSRRGCDHVIAFLEACEGTVLAAVRARDGPAVEAGAFTQDRHPLGGVVCFDSSRRCETGLDVGRSRRGKRDGRYGVSVNFKGKKSVAGFPAGFDARRIWVSVFIHHLGAVLGQCCGGADAHFCAGNRNNLLPGACRNQGKRGNQD